MALENQWEKNETRKLFGGEGVGGAVAGDEDGAVIVAAPDVRINV